MPVFILGPFVLGKDVVLQEKEQVTRLWVCGNRGVQNVFNVSFLTKSAMITLSFIQVE